MQRLLIGLALWTANLAFAQDGHLAYVKGEVGHVEPAAGGPAARLPQSEGTTLVSLAPSDGAALYFVEDGVADADTGQASLRGFLSLPPYSAAAPLPPPLDSCGAYRVEWTADGRRAFIQGHGCDGVYDRDSGTFRALPVSPESVSTDGSVVAYMTAKGIGVYYPADDRHRELFSYGRPQAMFDAIGRAAEPDKLADLREAIDPELWKQSGNWGIGGPALMPDGQRLFFAANAGTSLGASGNTTWAWFAADTATGKLYTLSKLGTTWARLPYLNEVSPDGSKLLAVTAFHINALSNPNQLYVIDLPTQAAREVLWQGRPVDDEEASLTWGAGWSPDSKNVVVSVMFYNGDITSAEGQARLEGGEAAAEAFTVRIQDAASGEIRRVVEGAVEPAWGG